MLINNKHITLLDCTLRDGGYYTNWDFPSALVEKYLSAVNTLPIDYVELGYRSLDTSSYHGEYNYLPRYVLQRSRQLCPNKKIAIMINLKEVDENSVVPLLGNLSPYVDLVRFATKPEDTGKAVKIARIAKEHGLETAVNIMYMSTWVENPEFAKSLKGAEQYVDNIMMVDSYGSVYPNQIADCIYKIRQQYNGKIGFHGHNNIELAFANSLAAIAAGIDSIDATMTGMGRGAGNLRTELLLTYCAKYDDSISLNQLMDTIEDFELLRQKYGWGTNLPYMISGCNSLPQKDIMEWITKKRYSASSIVRRLQSHIKPSNHENIYHDLPRTNKEEHTTMLIGGGESVCTHIRAILELIACQTGKVHLIFSSSKHLHLFDSVDNAVQRYIYMVGIEGKRLEKQLSSLRSSDTLVVSRQDPDMDIYIPSEAISQTYSLPRQNDDYSLSDSPLYASVKIAEYLGAESMLLLGYDGYDADIQSDKFNMMEETQSVIDHFANKHQMCSLLPTKYHNLKEKSIYSLLAL